MTLLVALYEEEDVTALTEWALRIARARGQSIEAVHPVVTPGQVEPMVLGADHPADRSVVDAFGMCLARLGVDGRITRVACSRTIEAVRFAVESVDPDVTIVPSWRLDEGSRPDRHEVSRLVRELNSDVLVLRAAEGSGLRCRSLLVPAAGGPHCRAALRLAADLVREGGVEATALYVEPEAGPEALEIGKRVLTEVVAEARLDQLDRIQTRVVIADDPFEGIKAAAGLGGYDMVLVGASNQSRLRQFLFGTVPERLMASPRGPAVGVYRRRAPVISRLRRSLEGFLEEHVPQMGRDRRVEVFQQLQEGSRAGFDFASLIGLSTAIASLGLIQNAPAVVIGAMLVAPLMTPMIGVGLALVQGNIVLARRALQAIGTGFLLALGIGFVAGSAVPIYSLTPELLARGRPNLLDLAIAFFSGIAAAYAYSRPHLSSALPGVAIAAALVPPIATSGISLALGEGGTALGAATLFGINLVAIVLGAAVSLYAVGARANRQRGTSALWARRALFGLFLVILVLSFPLASALLSAITPGSAELVRGLRRLDLGQPARVEAVRVDRREQPPRLIVEVRAPAPLTPRALDGLAARARELYGEPVPVLVTTRLEALLEAGPRPGPR